MKVLTVIGARPQFTKAAVVSRAFQTIASNEVTEYIVHTGQHYDHNLSEIFFEELQLPRPYRHLAAAAPNHNVMMGRMFEGIEEVISEIRPDWALVYGDTNSTVAGALAARATNTRLIHVEAGLRSFNRTMPEELNRITTDHISDLLFAPSNVAMCNLANESASGSAHMVGDVMYDNVIYQASRLSGEVPFASAKEFAFMTCHRAENTDDPERLRSLFEAVGRVSLPVLCPIHPRTAKALKAADISVPANITMVEPMGFQDLISHVKAAKIIITDSGGLQKEAFYLKKPCVILRRETEWVELLETGTSVLAGDNFGNLASQVDGLLSSDLNFKDIYGDGTAGEKIVDVLLSI
ncbi:MAG: non-hydrolyzing UDP-N-acetylglucosamine 2-epimerase [Pikeienuella sp.]